MPITSIKSSIKHPLVHNSNLDSPEAATIHSNIIKEKAFLKKIYEEWYDSVSKSLPFLEIGSRGRFP